MDVQRKREGILNLACTVLLAGAIGFTAIGAGTSGFAAPRLEKGDSVTDTGNRQPCDAADSSDPGQGRPGMHFMKS